MVKKSTRSAKAKASKKAGKSKINTNSTNDLRAAAKASALRRLKKSQ